MFFGTPRWAVPSLEALVERGAEVARVVTNPDKPVGRGLKVAPPPVKELARSHGLEVAQPSRADDPALTEIVAGSDADVCVVVAYGKILPGRLLSIPPLGFVNVHFSLLPAFRGAAPVQRAILDGAPTTGVSIMVLTEGMDEGPVLAARALSIDPDESAGSLGDRLASEGADLLIPTLDAYATGDLVPVHQDHGAATYAPKIAPEESRIDWGRGAAEIDRRVRAFDPEPGAWTTLRGKRLKVFSIRTGIDPGRELAPGELVVVVDEPVVGTGDGPVALREVQPSGKRRMAGADLARGLRLEGPERLG